MTINIADNNPRVSYSVSAGVTQTSFAVPFEFFDETDVLVYIDSTLKTITTDYTVSGGDGTTGTITMSVTGPATVALVRDITIERSTDFPTAGPFSIQSLNVELDKQIAIDADLEDQIDRAVRSPIEEFTTMTLPDAATRADKILKFDTDGNVAVESASALAAGAVVGANFTNNTFTGNGSQTAFTTTVEAGSKNNAQVYIDGVYQLKSSFSVSGLTLTFTEAPPLNSQIEVIIGNAIDTVDADSGNVNYNQGGTGAQTRTVESKLQEYVSVKDFGAVGDGVTDDTAAIQAAIDYCKTSGFTLHVNPGTYKLTSTLDLNDAYDDAVSIIGMGGFSNEPVLEFQDGVTIGLLVKNSKNTLIQDIKIDISNVTSNNCVAVLWNGVWHSKMSNVIIQGAGNTNPASNPTQYGIALRPTYNGAVTSKSSAVDLEAISSAVGINQGVYWNVFERLDVDGCSYGLTLYGAEGGTNPRTNQNQFNSCKINNNWFNILIDGAGGGNTFISCTAEEGGDTAVLVESISSGTTPIWIGGELSDDNNYQWKGAGLLLGAVSGTGFPIANASGDQGTNMRFSDQGPQLFGKALSGSSFIEGYDFVRTESSTSTFTHTTGTQTKEVLRIVGLQTLPTSFTLHVQAYDAVSPQGAAVAKSSVIAFDAEGSGVVFGDIANIHNAGDWNNDTGGFNSFTLSGVVSGDNYIITATLDSSVDLGLITLRANVTDYMDYNATPSTLTFFF